MHGAEARPRILVTNDDGIQTPGIRALATALREIADVTVIAPDTNRTAMSMASLLEVKRNANGKLETVKPHKLTKVNDASGNFFGYSLDLAPADCVFLGLEGIVAGGPFDFVVSGINKRVNLGRLSACTSGTIGAAALATSDSKWDVHAIAVSQQGGDTETDFALAASVARQAVQKIRAEGFPKGVVLSINVPKKPKGVTVAPLGPGLYVTTDPINVDGATGEFSASFGIRGDLLSAPGTDYFEHYAQGNVVLTPMHVYVVETNLFETLSRWSLSVNTTNQTPAK